MSSPKRKQIAIVGSGISGLTSAWLLSRLHDVTVFEADSRIGGHTATRYFELEGAHYGIDTGFIVFNDRTYPNFLRLLEQLDVYSKDTTMSFSVSCDDTGLEYSGSGLDGFFSQRKNILYPSHWGMLFEILKFNRQAVRELEAGSIDAQISLGEYLRRKRYSNKFRDYYLLPMGAAIWSSGTLDIDSFPLQFFIRFFKNHGLLKLSNRPQWKVLIGGSNSYLKPLTAGFSDNIRLSEPVKAIARRDEGGVWLKTQNGFESEYDHVIVATHSSQALKILSNPSSKEEKALASIPYKDNEVILHTDESLLPANRRAWSSWNYSVDRQSKEKTHLTYNMNILQGINSAHTFCVSLNSRSRIAEDKIIGEYLYSHPVFTQQGIAAQSDLKSINGAGGVWFCGAYMGNGFHEDGVVSALEIGKAFGISPW